MNPRAGFLISLLTEFAALTFVELATEAFLDKVVEAVAEGF